eukprot:764225-Hanusia_phi.AAC.1
MANLAQEQEHLKARRWLLVTSRFVADSLAPPAAGVRPCCQSVRCDAPPDREVLTWNLTAPLRSVCPTQHLPSRAWGAAELVNLGANLHGLMKYRAALSCFLTAAELGDNAQHKEVEQRTLRVERLLTVRTQVARQNAEVVRRSVAGFLSRTSKYAGEGKERRSGGNDKITTQKGGDVQTEQAAASRDRSPLTPAAPSERYQTIIGRHIRPVNCSLSSQNPVELANFAADVLYPSGRLTEALFCLDAASSLVDQPNISETSKSAIKMNLETMLQVLRPGQRERVYHNVGQRGAEFPDHMSRDHVPGQEVGQLRRRLSERGDGCFQDQTIQVWDGALSGDQASKHPSSCVTDEDEDDD